MSFELQILENALKYVSSFKNETECIQNECKLDETYKRAAHCVIFSRWNDKVFEDNYSVAAILMQLRFDGYLGFPGGMIDDGEDVMQGLLRELTEEAHLDPATIDTSKLIPIEISQNKEKQMIFYFYAYEVEYEKFKSIEKDVLLGIHYTKEVLGIIRPPLYCMENSINGFPRFLCNQFIGGSRNQLLKALMILDLIPKRKILEILTKSIEILNEK